MVFTEITRQRKEYLPLPASVGVKESTTGTRNFIERNFDN